MAVEMVSDLGLNDPGRPFSESIFDFTIRKYIIMQAVTSMASPVPMAAPITPSPNT